MSLLNRRECVGMCVREFVDCILYKLNWKIRESQFRNVGNISKILRDNNTQSGELNKFKLVNLMLLKLAIWNYDIENVIIYT